MMGGLTTDSFGEVRCGSTSCELHPDADDNAADGWARWQILDGLCFPHLNIAMGVDYHPCSLGDLKFKPFGVTPEPEVRHMLLEGGSGMKRRRRVTLTIFQASGGPISRSFPMECPLSSRTKKYPILHGARSPRNTQQSAYVHSQRTWGAKTTKRHSSSLSQGGEPSPVPTVPWSSASIAARAWRVMRGIEAGGCERRPVRVSATLWWHKLGGCRTLQWHVSCLYVNSIDTVYLSMFRIDTSAPDILQCYDSFDAV